jgi:hypothetical protein
MSYCESEPMPIFGLIEANQLDGVTGGVQSYVEWFYDGEDARYETN